MLIALVVGTRPETIKIAPIAELLRPEDTLIVHTRQHYNTGMTGQLSPNLILSHDNERPTTRGVQLGAWTSALARVWEQHRPNAVLVQGDTTSALAGALAANTTGTPLVHIEAGLRSFDRSMPEEHNRILIDHLADLCCAPSALAQDNLLAERIPAERVVTTGNTIVEAVAAALPSTTYQDDILTQLGLTSGSFVLATVHRPENADDPALLETILRELVALPVPVVLPLHPRTQRQITSSRQEGLASRLRLTGPLDYPALLSLTQRAALVITDSGGVQEEATILKTPILVIRRSNERPEIEGTFGTRLTPGPDIRTTATNWLAKRDLLRKQLLDQPSPYGDGTASAQIVHTVRTKFSAQKPKVPT